MFIKKKTNFRLKFNVIYTLLYKQIKYENAIAYIVILIHFLCLVTGLHGKKKLYKQTFYKYIHPEDT